MKVLLAGADICPPWSEGRKRFVKDLSSALARRQHEVHVLTTGPAGSADTFAVPHTVVPCRSRVQHLLALQSELSRWLGRHRPDLVCHFPHGTFRHAYGIVNAWHMWRIDRICAAASTPCLSIMYSISGEATVRHLRPWVRRLVLNQFCGTNDDEVVHLGVDFSAWPAAPPLRDAPSKPRLLFMAGMWQPTRARLEHVLRVRGLGVLLEAGKLLSGRGMTLTVAAPLLADPSLRRAVHALATNSWPAESIELRGQAAIPDVYLEHDLFVFPYVREETQFIPTSVIEAMRAGIPVVLPDLKFLQPLAENSQAFTFKAGDHESLAETVTAALRDRSRYARVRESALGYVKEELSIDKSCTDIEALYAKVVKR